MVAADMGMAAADGECAAYLLYQVATMYDANEGAFVREQMANVREGVLMMVDALLANEWFRDMFECRVGRDAMGRL